MQTQSHDKLLGKCDTSDSGLGRWIITNYRFDGVIESKKIIAFQKDILNPELFFYHLDTIWKWRFVVTLWWQLRLIKWKNYANFRAKLPTKSFKIVLKPSLFMMTWWQIVLCIFLLSWKNSAIVPCRLYNRFVLWDCEIIIV